jgi:glyoxylase-like metal-dependent hydrolase (beta-lactamase superfamily II)
MWWKDQGVSVPNNGIICWPFGPRKGAFCMVTRFDVITIGNLSRNRYWGEDEERRHRSTLCTCTLITVGDFRLLVDPSCLEKERMIYELDRRAGIPLEGVNAVFLTHEHGDHQWGLKHFEHAPWWASAGTADVMNAPEELPRTVEAVKGEICPGVEVIPTPGHTAGHSSLRFTCDGRITVVAGDAVMNLDFWRDREPYWNAEDLEQARATILALAETAQVIVPGHDNYFPA